MTSLILTLTLRAATIQLAGNWVCDIRELLLLLLDVLACGGSGVGVEPVGGLLDGLQDLADLLVKRSVETQME